MPRRPTPAVIAQRLQIAISLAIIPDKPAEPDFYMRTYPRYLRHFAKITSGSGWTQTRVVRCVRLVYTWMKRATKCEINLDIARQFAIELNRGTDDAHLIELARHLVNNSMVAGSKFLHFYAPDRFPITDSWLQKLSGTPGENYKLSYYLDYREAVKMVEADYAARALLWANSFFGYPVTSARAIESLAFYLLKGGWRHDGWPATPRSRGSARPVCCHSAPYLR